MMIILVTKDIVAREEIAMPYKLVEADVSETQKKLQQAWVFVWAYAICGVEKMSGPSHHKARVPPEQEVKRLCAIHTPAKHYVPNANIETRAEQRYSRLELTHDNPSEKLPRIALIDLGIWLCQARSPKSNNVLITAATHMLISVGYSMVVIGKSVRIDHAYCHLQGSAIDACMYMASTYPKQGEVAFSTRLITFVEELYRTIFG